MNPRKKPKFIRPLGQEYAKLGLKWRKPRGIHSKMRTGERGKARMPNIGWGAPRETRYLHPSGLRDVLVHNVNDLSRLDVGKDAARIAHTVGGRKRAEILKKAEEMKVKVLNP